MGGHDPIQLARSGARFPATACLFADDLIPRPASASRDMEIFDALNAAHVSRSSRVSAVLKAAYDVAGDAFDPVSLASMDRQVGLFRLALSYGQWPAWFVCPCQHCEKLIDLRVSRDEFVCETAAEKPPQTYPVFDVPGPGGAVVRFTVPNGAHELLLEQTNESPGAGLVSACLSCDDKIDVDDIEGWVSAFDAAMSVWSPVLETELRFACPYCEEQTGYWFDPLDWISRHVGHCVGEVHKLASAYGWSESAILAMSAGRRNAYISLLEAQA